MIENSLRIYGNAPRELDFDQPVVNIGSHPENDIAIAGQGVMPFHAMVVVQEGGYHLATLSPEARVRVDGVLVNEQNINLVENQQVSIGEYALSFRKNGTPTSMHITVSLPEAAGSTKVAPVSSNVDNAILVNILTSTAEVPVTQAAIYELEVVNAGLIVAGFTVKLQGVPDEWVQIVPRTFNLYEGQRTTVSIKVTAPRDPSSTAGKHSMVVTVSSPNYPDATVVSQLELIIQPYYEFSLGNLSPRQQNISYRKRAGTARLPIFNQGNGEADFNVSALDDENGCSFDFQVRDDLQLNRQATFNIPAGSSVNLPIEINPIKRRIFSWSSKRYQYTTTVSVAEQAVTPQIVSGSVTSFPLFGWWSIMLGIVAVLIGLFILLQPRINNFIVVAGKDVIELGDTTKLEWAVSPFATRLSISGVDQAITYGQRTVTVAPKQSTSYDLVAGNWLSGLLGIDQKKSQTVLVVPPTPLVNVFEVDNTTVARGKAVNIRWSVTQADSAILTIGGVVYELTPDKFSGEEPVVLDKDSLITLQANNASGSELRSYLINVVEPSITVTKFTVWVRPQTTSAVIPVKPVQPPVAAVSANQLVSLPLPPLSTLLTGKGATVSDTATTPTDDFTDKYVELVPDKTADSGYKVVFYEPTRELAKGEQVMIEWSVDGTDANTVQIAPFTDVLPDKGRQPFFPIASMNFVMTAQSGDQKKLFMLPVVVFDGTPPKAPTIDIYQASPTSMVGGGPVQFAWSVSGDWTHIQLANGKGIVADYIFPQGFKKVNVSANDTFILTAWNGTLSASKAIDITVNPALIDPGLVVNSIDPTTGRAQVGGLLTVTIGFTSIPSDQPYPTGQVTVTDGSAICSIPLPAVTCSLVFKTSGIKTITASFPGDKIFKQAQSAGFSQTVDVASSQVNLNPVFYFNGGTAPIAVESSLFELAQGVHIVVEVAPINTVLADNNGNISLSICDQDATGAMVDGSCTYVSAAPVQVAAATANGQTAGYGYADFVLQNFTKTGVHGFLFEYTHSANAIDPTSVFQPNIHINRGKLSLSLSTCVDPINFTSCVYGVIPSTSTEVIFDLNLPGQIPLSSLLPAPQIEAFTLSSNPAVTWACVVKIISGTYKLDCPITGTGLVSGTTYAITYGYDNTDPLAATGLANDYYMGSDPSLSFNPVTFNLNALTSSKVLIGSLSGITVGERIHLTGPTGGLVTIYNGANVLINPSTGLTLVETSGANIFGIANQGSNCSVSTNGSKVTVVAANVDCYIYFKHIGSYTISASFAGDALNNPSTSSDTLVNVLKQTKISAEIQYLDSNTGNYNSTFPTQWPIDTSLPIRAVFNGPLSNFSPPDTSFPSSALVGRNVLLTLNAWGINNCIVSGAGGLVTSAGTGIYSITITKKTIGSGGDPSLLPFVTAADFQITCTQTNTAEFGLAFTLVFSDQTTPTKDSDDFAFATSPVGILNIDFVAASVGTMTVSVQRQDTGSTEMVSGPSSINKLHFGQEYTVAIPSTSSISVQYQYLVKYTRLYNNGVLQAETTDVDPVAQSSNSRTAVLNQYAGSAKWSVDLSSFLDSTYTGGSTCGPNMSMTLIGYTITIPTPGETPESSTWVLTNSTTNGPLTYQYWNRIVNGTVTFELQAAGNQACKLVFDKPQNTDNIAISGGSIAFSATSGDGLFSVNTPYNVNGIDKQAVTMTFDPSASVTAPINTTIPVNITLASADITGGTSLSFLDPTKTFTQQFTHSTGSCTDFDFSGTFSPNILNIFSPTPYDNCAYQLSYAGNKYFKQLLNQNLPLVSFGKRASAVSFTDNSLPLPFSGGANANVTYPNLAIKVVDTFVGVKLIPTGSVKLQVLDSGNTTYPCAAFTLTVSPAVTCSGVDNSYTLPLDASGNTATFSLSFGPSMVSDHNKITLTYDGDSHFTGSNSTTSDFSISKYIASVDFTSTPSFITDGAYSSVDYTSLTIEVQKGSAPVTPTGSVTLQVLDNTSTPFSCLTDYTVTGGSCSTDTYTLDLTNGETAAFSITFNPSTISGGNTILLSYAGDTNFQSDTTSSAAFTVNKHASSVGFSAALPFASGAHTNMDYPLTIKVSDADNPVHASPLPSGSVTLQVQDNLGNPYACGTDYTVDTGTCLSGDASLTVSSGSTGAFNIQFKQSMISSGNTILLSYDGDSNFLPAPTTTTAAFDVSIHASSVAFTTLPSFIGGTAYTGELYSNLSITVSDLDGNVTPTGNVTLQVLDSSNTPYTCGTGNDYTVSVGTCSTDTYTLSLTGGSTSAFIITFNPAMISTGNTIVLSYAGDSNFLPADPYTSAAFDVSIHNTSVAFTAALPFASGAFTNYTYTPLNIQVSDLDGSLPPTGNVALQVLNGNTPYACSDYTLSLGTCSSGTYTLSLPSDGQTGSFNILFKTTMISTGNTISLVYNSDNSDPNFQGSSTTTAAFDISIHTSSVALSPVLPFSTIGFDISTPNMSIHVADTTGFPGPTPSGSVTLQLMNGTTPYTCSNYTLTTSPSLPCSSGAYILPLSGGNSASFSLVFANSMISTGNTIKLTYPGDSDYQTSNSTSTQFSVTKHTSSVAFTTTLPFVSSGFVNQTYPSLNIQVTDTSGSLIPTGSVTMQAFVSNTAVTDCSKIVLAPQSCASGVYTMALDPSGNTGSFDITFNEAMPAGTTFHLSYPGDTDFQGATGSSSAFAINKHGTSVAFTTALPFVSSGYTGLTYTGLNIQVSNTNGVQIPTGNVTLQAFNSANAPYTVCTNFDISPGFPGNCASGVYTLALDAGGNTGSFDITFNAAMPAGTKFKLIYPSNANFLDSSSSTAAFSITKHTSTVAFNSTPTFVGSTATKNSATPYTIPSITVADGETHGSLTSPTPTGNVTFQVIDTTNSNVIACNKYTVTVVTCSSGIITLPLTAASTASFGITFTDNLGNHAAALKLIYNGDSNFLTSNSTTATFTVIN